MNNYKKILNLLEQELKRWIVGHPSQKHLMYDSFIDHKSRYENDLILIDKYFKQGAILEIGANPYHITFCLKQLERNVIGVDINPDPYKAFLNKYNLRIRKNNIEKEKLPFEKNAFDFIIFNEVFEHLRINPILTLKEINRVLKRDGILLLTTPNLYAIHKIIMFNLGKGFNDAYDEFNKINKYGYMGHIREYSEKEVRKFLDNTGFKIERVIYRNDYSFFNYAGFKNFPFKLGGLIIDLLMFMNPYWRRHLAFIVKKAK